MIVNEETWNAYKDLQQAVEFYHKVQNCTPEERQAVGTDHWDWLIDSACNFIKELDNIYEKIELGEEGRIHYIARKDANLPMQTRSLKSNSSLNPDQAKRIKFPTQTQKETKPESKDKQ